MPDFSKTLPGIQEKVSLKDHTTYKIGGPANYFFVAKTKEDLLNVLEKAKEHSIKTFVLGGGSNLLVSDKGFDGLIVKVEIGEISIVSKNTIKAGAGVPMSDLVGFSVKNGLAGLEWSGGLPGTLGGAVRGNAGAFAGEIKDVVQSVEALDNNLNLQTVEKAECRFSYRSSLFKEEGWVVVTVILQLKKGDKNSLTKIAKSHGDYRKERHPLEYSNSGSIFKNVPLKFFSPDLQKRFQKVVKKDPFPVVPTAFLISEMGLKGEKIGNAQISKKHPNFLVNLGGAKAEDILGLISLVKKKAKESFNIDLETEVQMVGFD